MYQKFKNHRDLNKNPEYRGEKEYQNWLNANGLTDGLNNLKINGTDNAVQKNGNSVPLDPSLYGDRILHYRHFNKVE